MYVEVHLGELAVLDVFQKGHEALVRTFRVHLDAGFDGFYDSQFEFLRAFLF
jgi:hypothetical protein